MFSKFSGLPLNVSNPSVPGQGQTVAMDYTYSGGTGRGMSNTLTVQKY